LCCKSVNNPAIQSKFHLQLYSISQMFLFSLLLTLVLFFPHINSLESQ
jgi:hypothetical protein